MKTIKNILQLLLKSELQLLNDNNVSEEKRIEQRQENVSEAISELSSIGYSYMADDFCDEEMIKEQIEMLNS